MTSLAEIRIFQYPLAPLRRRHAPAGYLRYESFKPWLRDEFQFRCVYCLSRERWFPDGDVAFGIDHLKPQSEFPQLATDYENLVYACAQCNSFRGAGVIPSPGEIAYGQHLEIAGNGHAKPLSSEGAQLIQICRLNRSPLVEYRQRIITAHQVLVVKLERSPEVLELAARFFGYPDSLPNLKLLRPPLGNDRPDGTDSSFLEQHIRGLLKFY